MAIGQGAGIAGAGAARVGKHEINGWAARKP